ncbi:MAG: helix-hairpin-helix domain-containing protein [Candidatus Ozemobacteraceae bacterium]
MIQNKRVSRDHAWSGKTYFLVFFLLPFLLVASFPCFAWSGHTHRKIVSDALNRMPPAFKNRFFPQKESILKGSTYPDSDLKDFFNHVYHIHGTLRGGSLSRSSELFSMIIGMIQRKEGDREIAFQLGVYGHYIADWNQPLHTDGAEMDRNEDDYHMKFEKDVESRLSRISLATITYQPVKDPTVRLNEMATAANSSYLAIGKAYRQGRQIFDLQEMLQTQYQASVGNLCDYWLGIFAAAGQPFDLGSGTMFLGEKEGLGQEHTKVSTSVAASASSATSTRRVSSSRPLGEARFPGDIGRTFPEKSMRKPVDLNSATLEELQTLPGVGEKKARAIMAARPFRSPFDLGRVKGFGAKMTERIIDLITTELPAVPR